MRDLKLTSLSVGIGVVIAALGFIFKASVWETIQIILLQNILMFIIQIYLKQRDEDSSISVALSSIKSSNHFRDRTEKLITKIAESTQLKHDFFSEQIKGFLFDVTQAITSINSGVLKIDLRPGGFFFREAEAPETAKVSFWATSYVNPLPYWSGSIGLRLLNKSKKIVESKIIVRRIFIEHEPNIANIENIVQLNINAGISTKIVNADKIDHRLKRDFAIVDGGTLGVELILNEHRDPIEVKYYSSETEAGRRAIGELVAVWNQLQDASNPSAHAQA